MRQVCCRYDRTVSCCCLRGTARQRDCIRFWLLMVNKDTYIVQFTCRKLIMVGVLHWCMMDKASSITSHTATPREECIEATEWHRNGEVMSGLCLMQDEQRWQAAIATTQARTCIFNIISRWNRVSDSGIRRHTEKSTCKRRNTPVQSRRTGI